jgi:putative transposase
MKEAYAVRRTVPPSAEIQASIDKLLSKGMVDDPQKMLSELARLGARLIIQRAVEEEFDSWLGRARYERRPEGPRGSATGSGPGCVPRTGRRAAGLPRGGAALQANFVPGQEFIVCPTIPKRAQAA